ncbi:hypothetical protein HWD99_16915 [Microbacterium sp. C5A9]|uniref:hypothetical protein n=1 Tax=Microbacterium sp. C5A9 TaxID=2736663 RepID=UPI001F51DE9F|nr:hypothetical protein [Microbacterium sp. C5A9]MCI1020309.1 hypothetical protein [Microbacterium sp. C5A9]
MTPEIRRARTAFWWVGVIIPLALLVLAGLVVLAWLPEVPDPAAIHWGPTVQTASARDGLRWRS